LPSDQGDCVEIEEPVVAVEVLDKLRDEVSDTAEATNTDQESEEQCS
jgi:hypothetical protein